MFGWLDLMWEIGTKEVVDYTKKQRKSIGDMFCVKTIGRTVELTGLWSGHLESFCCRISSCLIIYFMRRSNISLTQCSHFLNDPQGGDQWFKSAETLWNRKKKIQEKRKYLKFWASLSHLLYQESLLWYLFSIQYAYIKQPQNKICECFTVCDVVILSIVNIPAWQVSMCVFSLKKLYSLCLHIFVSIKSLHIICYWQRERWKSTRIK